MRRFGLAWDHSNAVFRNQRHGTLAQGVMPGETARYPLGIGAEREPKAKS